MSERLTSEEIFQNIEIDSKGYRFVSKSDDHTISHKQLCSIFLSSDQEKYEEFKKRYLQSGQLRFLDGESLNGFKTAFMTYPRSGNTFLRKYLELITGVATGSDMPVENPMPLQMAGLLGEGVVDDSCWIVKTHYPMSLTQNAFSCNKVIICVRNPFDIIVSKTHFLKTYSHAK